MKLFSIFKKAVTEQLRDYWGLILTLITAPFFVTIYWLVFSGSSSTYKVLVINQDIGISREINYGNEAVKMMKDMKYENGGNILDIKILNSEQEAKEILTNKDASALLLFPPQFSSQIQTAASGKDSTVPTVKMVGNITNTQYPITSIMLISSIENFVMSTTKAKRFYNFTEEFIGKNVKNRTDFDLTVPGLLIFSIVMLVYSAAMTIMREVEDKTMKRLLLTPMTSIDYLGGIGLSQILLGTVSISVTFFFAKMYGFKNEGTMGSALVIALLTIVSIVSISLIVVSFCKTMSNVLVIGTFPLFLLMFLTGSMLPIPQAELFSIGSHSISYNALLPPTFAVNALNKIFLSGTGLIDVTFEIAALLLLSVFYFSIGIWLFKKKQMMAN